MDEISDGIESISILEIPIDLSDKKYIESQDSTPKFKKSQIQREESILNRGLKITPILKPIDIVNPTYYPNQDLVIDEGIILGKPKKPKWTDEVINRAVSLRLKGITPSKIKTHLNKEFKIKTTRGSVSSQLYNYAKENNITYPNIKENNQEISKSNTIIKPNILSEILNQITETNKLLKHLISLNTISTEKINQAIEKIIDEDIPKAKNEETLDNVWDLYLQRKNFKTISDITGLPEKTIKEFIKRERKKVWVSYRKPNCTSSDNSVDQSSFLCYYCGYDNKNHRLANPYKCPHCGNPYGSKPKRSNIKTTTYK
jgi:predicted RNA-binding Zn-ribbon protein involved in translation (DUF1610 family)